MNGEGNNKKPPEEGNGNNLRDASDNLTAKYKILTDKWCDLDNIAKQNRQKMKKLEISIDNTTNETKKRYLEEQLTILNRENTSILMDMRALSDEQEDILMKIDRLYPEKDTK